MNSEPLTSLGETLWRDFQALLTEHIINWLDDEPLSQADIQPVHALQADLAELAFVAFDLAGLEAWFTSGFVPTDLALLNNPAASMVNENRAGQDHTPADTHSPSLDIGGRWATGVFSRDPLAQTQRPSGDAATVKRGDSDPLAIDIRSFQRPIQTPPPVQGLDSLARWIESEPNAPGETSTAAGRVAATAYTRSRPDPPQAASSFRPAMAMSEKLGEQDLEVAGPFQTSDDRSVFRRGAVAGPPAMIPTGSTTEPASRSASGVVPTIPPTLPRSSAMSPDIADNRRESAQVQPGVTSDKPPKRGAAVDWPDDEAAGGSYVSSAESPARQVDLAEILDALARSIEQEYKRFYGR